MATAAPLVPSRPTLKKLRDAAAECRACDLWKTGTQTVFGEGAQRSGIDRSKVYVTNVVKHFKWEPRGKRRIHKKPNAEEIGACRPWLQAEIDVVRLRVIVCLGSTAAQAVIGPKFRVSTQRATFVDSPPAPFVTATVHPSSILRAPTDERRHAELARFIEDLKKIRKAIA